MSLTNEDLVCHKRLRSHIEGQLNNSLKHIENCKHVSLDDSSFKTESKCGSDSKMKEHQSERLAEKLNVKDK